MPTQAWGRQPTILSGFFRHKGIKNTFLRKRVGAKAHPDGIASSRLTPQRGLLKPALPVPGRLYLGRVCVRLAGWSFSLYAARTDKKEGRRLSSLYPVSLKGTSKNSFLLRTAAISVSIVIGQKSSST